MYDNSNHGGYFNSGIVIEPISSLQEQLEEMTEEQKVIAIEKYLLQCGR